MSEFERPKNENIFKTDINVTRKYAYQAVHLKLMHSVLFNVHRLPLKINS